MIATASAATDRLKPVSEKGDDVKGDDRLSIIHLNDSSPRDEEDPSDPLTRLYAQLDQRIRGENPACDASGRCCRFKEYGHTLFLTQMEADRLLSQGLPPGAVISDADCPFQIQGLCSARDRRPSGCRIYFCDPAYQGKMVEISEEFVTRLKRLHEQLGRDWDYRPLASFLEKFQGNRNEPLSKPQDPLDEDLP